MKGDEEDTTPNDGARYEPCGFGRSEQSHLDERENHERDVKGGV
jgi:hypothetical protein